MLRRTRRFASAAYATAAVATPPSPESLARRNPWWVVHRISRTEYVVRYQLRDSASGTVLSAADTGLRMGADYSWNRGAVRLIRDRLLAVDPVQ